MSNSTDDGSRAQYQTPRINEDAEQIRLFAKVAFGISMAVVICATIATATIYFKIPNLQTIIRNDQKEIEKMHRNSEQKIQQAEKSAHEKIKHQKIELQSNFVADMQKADSKYLQAKFQKTHYKNCLSEWVSCLDNFDNATESLISNYAIHHKKTMDSYEDEYKTILAKKQQLHDDLQSSHRLHMIALKNKVKQ